MKVLGIDSGCLGALCFYDGVDMEIHDMPIYEMKGKKLVDAHSISRLIKSQKPDFCMLERTHATPIASKVACYSMGHSFGVLIGIIATLQLPYDQPVPSVWKRAMECPADKELARQRATNIMPQFAHFWPLKKHDGRAESALLAFYGLNKNKVDISA